MNYRDKERQNNEEKIGKIKFKNSNFISIENLINRLSLYDQFMEREMEYGIVIRIFGTTFRGQKCCLNIHNYFPYFYVEINTDNYFHWKIMNI